MAEYTGLNFFEVADLNYLQYLIWRRDAYIHWLSRTETGQKYLDNAWRMEETVPDRQALRKKIGKDALTDG